MALEASRRRGGEKESEAMAVGELRILRSRLLGKRLGEQAVARVVTSCTPTAAVPGVEGADQRTPCPPHGALGPGYPGETRHGQAAVQPVVLAVELSMDRPPRARSYVEHVGDAIDSVE